MVNVLFRGPWLAIKSGPLVVPCRCCKSLFEFEAREARREPDRLDGDALVIDCPVCGREQWFAVPKLADPPC